MEVIIYLVVALFLVVIVYHILRYTMKKQAKLDNKYSNNVWFTLLKLTIGIALFTFLMPSLIASKNWTAQLLLIMFTVGLLLQGYKLFRQIRNPN